MTIASLFFPCFGGLYFKKKKFVDTSSTSYKTLFIGTAHDEIIQMMCFTPVLETNVCFQPSAYMCSSSDGGGMCTIEDWNDGGSRQDNQFCNSVTMPTNSFFDYYREHDCTEDDDDDKCKCSKEEYGSDTDDEEQTNHPMFTSRLTPRCPGLLTPTVRRLICDNLCNTGPNATTAMENANSKVQVDSTAHCDSTAHFAQVFHGHRYAGNFPIASSSRPDVSLVSSWHSISS
jgi:hypothetical protein